MEAIRLAIRYVLEEGHPMSVRQVYYQLTTLGVIDKTEKEYKSTVVRLLGEMRRDGTIPYWWLADATRWMRKPDTYDSAAEAVEQLASVYRRNLWSDSDVVELWVEKEALAGVLVEVTEKWDVPLMVTRGYPSMSFLYSGAVQVVERWRRGRQTILYYMGDHDPSGTDIDRAVVDGMGQAMRRVLQGLDPSETPFRSEERQLYLWHVGEEPTEQDLDYSEDTFWGQLPSTDDEHEEQLRNQHVFHRCGANFQRLGVLPWQIKEWELPSRPTKRTDTRSKDFTGESVELDAIPTDQLRALAEEAIEQHVDRVKLQKLETVEQEERRGLEKLAATFRGEG